LQDKEKYPPIIANGPWVTERIVGPHESLAGQIQRRTGMKAQDIKTIVLRLVSCFIISWNTDFELV
jgi:sporulation-control protein spo0M